MIGHRLGEFALTRTAPIHKTKEAKIGAKKINPNTGKANAALSPTSQHSSNGLVLHTRVL
ncbi:uncharacterized protein HaLaN_29704 [Haematococcus lacustris]|uniref:Uncharacterized protein n=1 Tax=Haematococcus lacustris TaxID=44745 RepID=A0A6A0AFE7_HAELA|nr:uncharacterized protein HaLaN_29704 [Haematococcus lacustris]